MIHAILRRIKRGTKPATLIRGLPKPGYLQQKLPLLQLKQQLSKLPAATNLRTIVALPIISSEFGWLMLTGLNEGATILLLPCATRRLLGLLTQ